MPRVPDQFTAFLAPAQSADELGRLGGYRVLKILGQGGMGVVYLAEDVKLRRKVALKAMLPDLAHSTTSRQRFLREAQAAAALEHDHIVPILHVGEDRGAPFIVMPFLKGESLEDRLKRDTSIPVSLLVQVGLQIADALAAAHAQGLLHRDIKPANIWLESRETNRDSQSRDRQGAESGVMQQLTDVRGSDVRVKLLDFGLARLTQAEDAEHLTQTGAILGTPGYMPPEQVNGQELDGRADLFSLGCVLYRMATGKPAFSGETITARLLAVTMHQPDPPGRLNPAIPQALSDIIMRLLAKIRADRPASARQAASVLAEIGAPFVSLSQNAEASPTVNYATASAVTAGLPTSAPRLRRRNPWLIAGGLTLSALLLVAGIVLFRQTPQGTVRIESDDPDVEIVFDQVGPTIKGTSKEPIALGAGAHAIRVKRGAVSIDIDKFVIEQGKAVTLKFEILPGKWQLVHDGKVLGARDLPLTKDFKNSLGMEFVLVPKGTGWLGGGGGKVGDKEVTIDYVFFLGKYEVTQEEWVKVMKKNPSAFSRTGREVDKVAKLTDEQLRRFPVESISWDDAHTFLLVLNEMEKKSGWVYRLPTEAEWEYACRGGAEPNKEHYGFDYYLDRPTKELDPNQANYQSEKESVKSPRPVGSYPPNRLGLHDMHGNVREWCVDSDLGGAFRVSRGGCFFDISDQLRAALFCPLPPFHRFECGLRLVRVPADVKIPRTEPKLPPSPYPSLDPAWLKKIQPLSPMDQVQEVIAELKRRNPEFDGQGIMTTTSDGRVVVLEGPIDKIGDISPLKCLEYLERIALGAKKGSPECHQLNPQPFGVSGPCVVRCGVFS